MKEEDCDDDSCSADQVTIEVSNLDCDNNDVQLGWSAVGIKAANSVSVVRKQRLTKIKVTI